MKNLLLIAALLLHGALPAQTKYYPIGNQLGVVVHPYDVIASQGSYGPDAAKQTADKQKAIMSTGFTWLRMYVDAMNIKSADNSLYGFNPTINQGGGFAWEDGIKTLKANTGIKVNVCIQNQPINIQSEWRASGTKSTQYRHPFTNPANPATWSEVAKDFGVMAARMGTNPNAPDYPLFQSPNWWDVRQVMVKGSGVADQIEPLNEADHLWSCDEPLNGSTYPVLWKACFDAAKKADPNMQVSSTGVMTENPQFLIDVQAWAKTYNNGVIPFDVYQFHCYPWLWFRDIANAGPPELNMIPAAKKVVAASNGIPADIGEWGYDLHPNSDLGIRPFSGYTAEQVRAYWILRSILGFAATGIKKSFYYRIYQDDGLIHDNDPVTFQTSSLFWKDGNDNIKRRLGGDAFKQISQFAEYVFDKVIVENSSMVVYRFKNGANYLYTGWTVESVALVTEPNGIWSTNRAVITEKKADYIFPSAGTRYDLAEDSSDFMKSRPYYGDVVQLSSKPVFIVTSTALPIRRDTIYQRTDIAAPWYQVEVFNEVGQLIMKTEAGTSKEVAQRLKRGFYILRFTDGKKSFTQKIYRP